METAPVNSSIQYHYAVTYLNNKQEVDSTLAPEDFVKHTTEVLSVVNVTLKSIGIWQKHHGGWIPVQSDDKQESQTIALFPMPQENFKVLGERVINVYESLKRSDKNIRRRKSTGRSDEALHQRHQEILRRIAVVDDIVAEFSKKQLQSVFELKVRKGETSRMIERLMYISAATVSRLFVEIKEEIGMQIKKRVSDKELADWLSPGVEES